MTNKLPVKAMPTATVDIDGTAIEVRGLSRAEALKLNTSYSEATADEAEVFVLSHGASVDEDEAREWLQTTDTTTAGLLIDKIIELSGIIDQNGKAPK